MRWENTPGHAVCNNKILCDQSDKIMIICMEPVANDNYCWLISIFKLNIHGYLKISSFKICLGINQSSLRIDDLLISTFPMISSSLSVKPLCLLLFLC